jgi:hypothetical protein
MQERESAGRELAKGAGLLFVHLLAVVAGAVFMIVGLAMGVSVVMLPAGVPVGFFGLFVFLWGLFGWFGEEEGAARPPSPR